MKTTRTILILLFLGVLVCLPFQVASQVTIGSENPPRANTVLDLDADDLGLLLPRVALEGTTVISPMTGASIERGMLVYNTATATDVTPGVYYHDSQKWVRLLDGGPKGLNVVTVPSSQEFITVASSTDALVIVGSYNDNVVTLPTDVAEGKIIYIVPQESGVTFTNNMFSTTYIQLVGGMPAAFMYIGGTDKVWAMLNPTL